MNASILNTDVQEFIRLKLNADITTLALKNTSFLKVETKEIIEQIEAKKRSKTKLPTWFSSQNIYYPNKLNIEQTSSEVTAKYKSLLLNGSTIVDLTGGFGVDCFYFSKQFKNVKHCEINESLSNIVNHNFNQLNNHNIETIHIDGITYLKNTLETFDWIYIDPSRRHDSKGKVFFLNDCLPNVPEHLTMLFKYSNNIMIKTSPLLDLSIGINELKHIKTIHVVAVNNEVKELLWILEKGFNNSIGVETVNIKKGVNHYFKFNFNAETITIPKYSLPLTYLFEPNAAILKAGAFNEVSQQLGAYKIHKHSHLYTSDTCIDFPGRVFKINHVFPYNKKVIKKLAIKKANVTTRNFPETVQQIRQRFKINDGGNVYLFFTTDINNNKILLITNKA